MDLKIIDYPLDKGEWIATSTKKRYVVWHATGGRTEHTNEKNLISPEMFTINDWNIHSERIGAPWLIGRSGVVYRTFPDSHWCKHLRLDKIGSLDRDSVAIEITNEGPLSDGVDSNPACYWTTFDNHGVALPYTADIFRVPYVLGFGDKGRPFANYSEEQLKSLMTLTLDVCERFGIKPKLCGCNSYNESTIDQATVFTHSAIDEKAWDFHLTPRVLTLAQEAGIEIIK